VLSDSPQIPERKSHEDGQSDHTRGLYERETDLGIHLQVRPVHATVPYCVL